MRGIAIDFKPDVQCDDYLIKNPEVPKGKNSKLFHFCALANSAQKYVLKQITKTKMIKR